jgi:hypothetical protein
MFLLDAKSFLLADVWADCVVAGVIVIVIDNPPTD